MKQNLLLIIDFLYFIGQIASAGEMDGKKELVINRRMLVVVFGVTLLNITYLDFENVELR